MRYEQMLKGTTVRMTDEQGGEWMLMNSLGCAGVDEHAGLIDVNYKGIQRTATWRELEKYGRVVFERIASIEKQSRVDGNLEGWEFCISTQPHSDAVTDSVALYGCTEDEGVLTAQTDEDVYEWLTTYDRESYYSDDEKAMLYRELGGHTSVVECEVEA